MHLKMRLAIYLPVGIGPNVLKGYYMLLDLCSQHGYEIDMTDHKIEVMKWHIWGMIQYKDANLPV